MHARHSALLLALLGTGCSLIVGSKLDEKPDGGAKVSDGTLRVERKVPTTITGEKGTGEGPYLIGEQVEFPTSKWPGAATIYIGGVPCLGRSTGPTIICTVSPNTPDGKPGYVVKDAGGKTLNAALGDPIQIRRLVVGGMAGQRNLVLKDQATLEDVPAIELGESLVEAKLSPSGRFVLARVQSGLVLVDLVNHAKARLPPVCQHLAGSSFEPSFEMILSSGTNFMFYRPEPYLWCTEQPGKPMMRVALPAPPAPISDGMKVEPPPVAVPGALQSTSIVDLSGQAWMAGISGSDAAREIFAVNLTAKPPAMVSHKLDDPKLIPEQVVISPIEKSGTFSLDSYLVVRAAKAGELPRAILFHPDGPNLVRKGELFLTEDGTPAAIDLRVQALVWMPYTNLIAFDRGPSSKVFAYLRVVQGAAPGLELVKPAVAPLGPQEIRAFSYSPVAIALFVPVYKERVGTVVGNRIIVHQEQPSEVQVDATPAGFTGGRVLGHPVYERLLLLSGGRLSPYKPGTLKSLVADGQGQSFAADAALIQP